MKLLEFRKLFEKITGRYDLTADGGKDDGLDFFINAAQRMLDSRVTHSQSHGLLELKTTKGIEVYGLPGVLSVESVSLIATDSKSYLLTKLSEDEIRDMTLEGEGLPRYYGVVTQLRSNVLGNSKENFQKLAIKLFATPDNEYGLNVRGRLTKTLRSDADVSFWTINYPDILIKATQYQLEVFHRNRAGSADFLMALETDIRNIENDLIETEVGDLNQMRDSFPFKGQGNAR